VRFLKGNLLISISVMLNLKLWLLLFKFPTDTWRCFKNKLRTTDDGRRTTDYIRRTKKLRRM